MGNKFNSDLEYGNQFYSPENLDNDLDIFDGDPDRVLPTGTSYTVYRTTKKHKVDNYEDCYSYCWRYPDAPDLGNSIKILRKEISK
jgi:hypothetical protein